MGIGIPDQSPIGGATPFGDPGSAPSGLFRRRQMGQGAGAEPVHRTAGPSFPQESWRRLRNVSTATWRTCWKTLPKYPVGGAPDYNAGQMTGRGHSDVEAIGPLPARLDVVPVHHPPPAGFCPSRPSVDSHRRAVRFRRASCSPGSAAAQTTVVPPSIRKSWRALLICWRYNISSFRMLSSAIAENLSVPLVLFPHHRRCGVRPLHHQLLHRTGWPRGHLSRPQ